jgi:hyperosmotically inducible periplasmic protein
MRRRSTISALIAVLLIVGLLYYFYGYRYRSIAADLNTVEETTADIATTAAVKTALMLNNRVSSFDIHVETKDNNVTLSGQVPTSDDRSTAAEIARSTKGVANVVNNLTIDPKLQGARGERQRTTDLEIKASVLESILSNPELKSQQIRVDVDNGAVTLSGKVQTSAQKSAAESAARAVANVGAVDSHALAVTGNK